jgi:hypothetical protein
MIEKFNSLAPCHIKSITIKGRKGCILTVPSLATTKFGNNQTNLATNKTGIT